MRVTGSGTGHEIVPAAHMRVQSIRMTVNQFDEFHHARPFRPFRIHFADGRSFQINHPELVLRTPEGRRTIAVAAQRDAFAILDLMLVTSIEHVNGAEPKKRRRQPRRRR